MTDTTTTTHPQQAERAWEMFTDGSYSLDEISELTSGASASRPYGGCYRRTGSTPRPTRYGMSTLTWPTGRRQPVWPTRCGWTEPGR